MFKQFLHQLQAMFICYPTIYDMTMLALASYMKILIEWKYMYIVYPDSILNFVAGVYQEQLVLDHKYMYTILAWEDVPYN